MPLLRVFAAFHYVFFCDFKFSKRWKIFFYFEYMYTWIKEMKYKKLPVEIEAITFEELIEYGKNNGSNIVNGMPWSFNYAGHPITYENDDCYLIPTLEGMIKFNRGDMLITGINGEIYPCKPDIFKKTYEKI